MGEQNVRIPVGKWIISGSGFRAFAENTLRVGLNMGGKAFRRKMRYQDGGGTANSLNINLEWASV